MSDILDLIDDTLTDWSTSADAMHWSADDPGEFPERCGYTEDDLLHLFDQLNRTLTEEPDHLPDGRLRYTLLTTEQQAALHAWVELHQIELHRVPINTELSYDPTTREWRIEVYVLRDREPFLDGEVLATRVLRRAERAPLPWPTHPTNNLPEPT